MKKDMGITLIALVITIIVLLILAGVSIATLAGNNGILIRTNNAKVDTEDTEEKEKLELAIVGSRINETLTITNEGLRKEIIDQFGTDEHLSGTGPWLYSGKRKTYKIQNDGTINSNLKGEIQIPEGFVYVGGKKESGLVISDNKNDENKYQDEEQVGTDIEGNQYVWIPVDGILGEKDTTISDVVNEDNTINKILLGRYTINNLNLGILLDMSTSTNYLEETPEQHEISGYQNAIAVDITDFINSVRKNGGYYIARFEASQGTEDKAQSKYDQEVWHGLKQPIASQKCQNLYTTIKSDLVNGYAWDTAIAFIQKYSGDTKYSAQKSLQNSLAHTGKATNGSSYDVRCNIFDMAGNCWEYTTETSTRYKDLDGGYPSVARGNHYYQPEHGYSPNYAIDRYYINNGDSVTNSVIRSYGSFRPILYF